jgi:hypothetical protein
MRAMTENNQIIVPELSGRQKMLTRKVGISSFDSGNLNVFFSMPLSIIDRITAPLTIALLNICQLLDVPKNPDTPISRLVIKTQMIF